MLPSCVALNTLAVVPELFVVCISTLDAGDPDEFFAYISPLGAPNPIDIMSLPKVG